jgi:hypothetical protein
VILTSNSSLGRHDRAVVTRRLACSHHRHAHLGHHGAHIGKIHVDEPGPGDQFCNALDSALQHVIRGLEGVQQQGLSAQHITQLRVGNCDQRIDVRRQLLNALFGDLHPPAGLEMERFGHHCDGQYSLLLGSLCNDRSRTRTGASPHSGRYEHHVCAGQHFHDVIPVLEGSLPADFRICTGSQALGHAGPDLQDGFALELPERLSVRVGCNEFHAINTGIDHLRNRVATTTADTDYFDRCAGCVVLH